MNDKIQVLLPSSLIGDIKFLHNRYKGLEWSGYLYYESIGDISEPSELVLKVTDFVLLDIGSPGATDIKPSPDQVIDMYENRPHLIENQMKHGVLHTHHNMSVFFSGTDTDTLLAETDNFDYFLSIIVNEKGDIIGKVSQKTEVTVSYKYTLFRNQVKTKPKTEELILVYDCNINITPTENIIKEHILIDSILEEKKRLYQESKKYNPNSFLLRNNNIPQYDMFSNVREFREDLEIEEVDAKAVLSFLSGKEKIELFIKCCIIITDDIDFGMAYTYQQCKEEYELNYKGYPGCKKAYEDSLLDEIDSIFYTIYGILEKAKLDEVVRLFNIYIKDGLVETSIKKIFKELVEMYESELNE